ncbi:STAS domain-containing protein [Nocardia noduli]|uniref:STAS domain-containing protein n=1 Tax=Nocardia noduli TaxID=2815722 RepID=UPI001C22757C|nr:STAS domain-containing protein [Nocardia noduli]
MNTEFATTSHATTAGPVLAFTGDLDAHTAHTAYAAIQRVALSRGQLLLIDLAGLRLCDSSGISALIAASHRATDTDAGFALVAVPPNLARVLTLIGLDRVFTTYPDVEQAHTAWRAAASPEART